MRTAPRQGWARPVEQLRERVSFQALVGRAGWRVARVAEGNPVYDFVRGSSRTVI
jgi:hypothetical protein